MSKGLSLDRPVAQIWAHSFMRSFTPLVTELGFIAMCWIVEA